MSANFKLYIPTPNHNKPLTDREIERECDKERQYHSLFFRGSVALCNCGKSYIDPTRRDIRWRHDHHVKLALEAFENKLRGISNE
ncbi:MAG TPA: hypothetical protein VN039_12335 [Nitrospira sp.]|nr:hypothetical protein [Nitrospira sp.]